MERDRDQELKRDLTYEECQQKQAYTTASASAYPGSTDPMYLAIRRAQIEQQVRHLFACHPPRPEQVGKYELLRTDFTNLAIRLMTIFPDGGEGVHEALMALSDALMAANRAIALG